MNWFRPVVIVAGKRTPVTPVNGKLSRFTAPELSSLATKAAIQSINLPPEQIDEVILGNMIQAGVGQNPARQASLGAGIPIDKPCTTINQGMTSCIKTLIYASRSITMGISDTVVTGGFESMSRAPFFSPNYRKGHPFGQTQIIDAIVQDGLTDVYSGLSMGQCAEKIIQENNISREDQDEYAIGSYERIIAATASGKLKNEIIKVEINEKETISQDEEPKRFKKEKFSTLKPVFDKEGTLTAGNSSKLGDGAVSLSKNFQFQFLMAEEKAKILGLKPLVRILSYGEVGVDPFYFTTAPQLAAKKALERIGKSPKDIDYYEIHEAFAMTILYNMKKLGISRDRVNLHGGAISIGHPLGMSAARSALSLITVLKEYNGKLGLVVSCTGGGGATSLIFENLN